jgi:hypothetical protein
MGGSRSSDALSAGGDCNFQVGRLIPDHLPILRPLWVDIQAWLDWMNSISCLGDHQISYPWNDNE